MMFSTVVELLALAVVVDMFVTRLVFGVVVTIVVVRAVSVTGDTIGVVTVIVKFVAKDDKKFVVEFEYIEFVVVCVDSFVYRN